MSAKDIIRVLNDLVTLNKNRIVGYKEALHSLKNEKAADRCRKMILQSEKFNEELRARLRDSGADADDTTSTSGLIYNTWMDIVYSEEKEPEADIRNFCRQMEDTFAEGYEAALKNTVTAYPVEYDMIKRQKSELEHSGGLPGL